MFVEILLTALMVMAWDFANLLPLPYGSSSLGNG